MAASRRFRPVVLILLAATVAVAPSASGARAAGGAQTLVVASTADGYYENPKLPSIGKYPTNESLFKTMKA